jgi:hypothetical protein
MTGQTKLRYRGYHFIVAICPNITSGFDSRTVYYINTVCMTYTYIIYMF